MPSMQQYQANRSPVGASQSKNGFLLRNTFSLAVYQEFLKHKKKLKSNKIEAENTEQELAEAQERLHEHLEMDQRLPEFLKTQNFKQKMEIIKSRRIDKE